MTVKGAPELPNPLEPLLLIRPTDEPPTVTCWLLFVVLKTSSPLFPLVVAEFAVTVVVFPCCPATARQTLE
jgi:hypothetical protein